MGYGIDESIERDSNISYDTWMFMFLLHESEKIKNI